MKKTSKKNKHVYVSILAVFILLFAGIPISLLFPVVAGESESELEGLPNVHYWDFNIEDIGHGKWRYRAETDDYNVSFSKNSHSKLVKINTKEGDHSFKLKMDDLYCTYILGDDGNNSNLYDRINSSFLYQSLVLRLKSN